ncbi:hypothetical protein [Gimesia panareensis]|uniref:Uncharacterized protein n=1 Tax=Gimesia panareensis TaxID=2527978 RepID=A0A518A8Z9_9PLAN|nr:hypothetical protein [Gimesia panareensis]QDU51202.1 hypothetical protein Pan110_35660 [Gimesia panareensis]QDV19069.1 hypothetical protein Pan153_37320 [Gimesia panareensis]
MSYELDNPISNTTATFAFSYKTIWDHAKGFFSRPLPLLTFASASFGGFWSIYEASVSSLDLDANRPVAYAWILAFSVISSGVARLWAYVNTIPDGLEELLPHARRIAHLQQTKWEFRFAKSVLAYLISPIDREWQDIRNDNVYVVASRPRDFRSYFQWLAGRPDNCFRMLKVAKKTMLLELPQALISTEETPADPKRILDRIQTIVNLYRESVAFEKASLAIIPPDEMATVHKLQIGWAEPIRDAVHQLFELLQDVCDVDPNTDSNLKFTITFEVPPNIDDYYSELDRVKVLLPQIMENEW